MHDVDAEGREAEGAFLDPATSDVIAVADAISSTTEQVMSRG